MDDLFEKYDVLNQASEKTCTPDEKEGLTIATAGVVYALSTLAALEANTRGNDLQSIQESQATVLKIQNICETLAVNNSLLESVCLSVKERNDQLKTEKEQLIQEQKTIKQTYLDR